MALRVRWPLVVTCTIDLTDDERRKGIISELSKKLLAHFPSITITFFSRCEVIQYGRTKTFKAYNL